MSRLGIEDDFYPLRSAANYGLLVLATRVFLELSPRSVLDIGAGQSSVLWSRLSGTRPLDTLVTLEQDGFWGGLIQKKVQHDVVVSPLSVQTIGGRQSLTYDWTAIKARGPFEVISCDGPLGEPRFSRYGVMAMIDETLPPNFVIIMDDSERLGEQDTVAAILERLRALGRTFKTGEVKALKRQTIIAGGDYSHAAYF